MCLAYLEFAKRHPVVFRLMFNNNAITERTEEFLQQSSAAYSCLQDAVRALDPDMSDARFDTLINTVWAMLHGLSILELEDQVCRTATPNLKTQDFLVHGIGQLVR